MKRAKRPTRREPERKGAARPGGWRRALAAHRRELRFLALFVALVAGGFTLISWNPVNDGAIEPLTAGIARLSGEVLDLLGQDIRQQGTALRNESFAVNVENGCNGVETLIIFGAAVLAFPAPWRARMAGLVLGTLAIQLVNLVRVVALFLTGAYFPDWFDSSHTVVWQSVVIAAGVLLWIFWADRVAVPASASAR